MTVIAGVVHGGRVFLAGDSAGSAGWELRVRADPKVFANGPYVFGFTGSYRMGQLLQYVFEPPVPEEGADLHRFMVAEFIPALRKCLSEGGYARKESEQETGGTFLVGIRNRLFGVESDYQVAEGADSYAAVGCGAQVALGSLHSTESSLLVDPQDPQDRLHRALSAAERFSNGVRGPFHLAIGRTVEPTTPVTVHRSLWEQVDVSAAPVPTPDHVVER